VRLALWHDGLRSHRHGLQGNRLLRRPRQPLLAVAQTGYGTSGPDIGTPFFLKKPPTLARTLRPAAAVTFAMAWGVPPLITTRRLGFGTTNDPKPDFIKSSFASSLSGWG